MRKIFYIILLSSTLYRTSYAQIGVPVDLQTGNPYINIPIHEIKNGDVSIPISLSYHQGVKIAQPYGNDGYNIGVGWSIDAGGTITRSVKSLPDDYTGTGTDTRMGWLYGSGSPRVLSFTPQSRTDCSGDVANYNTLNSLVNSNADTEPDVFNFNFGGYSGQFMFDNNKVIRTLPYSDLNIQPSYSASGSIASFTITTNNGMQYTFMPTSTITLSVTPADVINNVHYLRDKLIKYAQPITYTTAWGLTAVNSPSGGALLLSYGGQQPGTNINLEVIDTVYTNPPSTDIYLANNNTSNSWYQKKLFYTKTITDTKLLSGISESVAISYPGIVPDNEQINFVYGASNIYNPGANNGPSNTNHQTKLTLTAFQVYITSNLIKTISLNTINVGGYYFLQSLHEFANNCTVSPPYEFEYLGTTLRGIAPITVLPAPQGTVSASESLDYCQQDYWGYFNGNKATTLVPNLYMYPNEPLQERYRLQQIPGYTGVVNALSGGADRTVSPGAITAGSLSRVIFPTGGSVKIDYEPNQYIDARTNQTFFGGGIRAKTVTLHDGINASSDIVKNYTYSGGLLVNRPQFAFSIPVYTDYGGALHTINEYSDQPTQARFFTALFEYDLNPYDFDSPDVLYQSGTESQAGKGKIVYQYSNPATYAQLTSPEYAAPNQWQSTYSQYATTTNPSSGTCMSQGLMTDGYYGFPYPTNPNYSFERGVLQNAQVFNETGQLIKRTDYNYTPVYQNTSPVSIYGLTCDYFTYSSNDINTKAFAYGKYRLLAAMNKYQTTTIEKTYDPGTNFVKAATVEKDAFYNGTNHTLLSSTQTTTSNDGTNATTYKTKYTYPQDYTASTNTDPVTAGILALKTNYMNNTVIEKVSSITKPGQSEQVNAAQLNKFNIFSVANPQITNTTASFTNKVLPSQMLILKTNAPLTNFTPSTINSNNQFVNDTRYQITVNIQEYSKGGNPVSHDDGHQNLTATLYDITGLKPVAYIKNALANQVLYSNFDNDFPTFTTLHSFDESPTAAYSLVNGRIGKGLLVAPPNFTFTKSVINKGPGLYYAFSCWISTTNPGSMTVTLTDAASHSNSGVITYTNTTGVWTYYRIRIPVNNLNSTFSIKVQNSNVPVNVDDMLFHPELAQVILTGYQNKLKIADTDPHGNTTFYAYDGLSRPTIVTDQNQNILKRLVYSYRSDFVLNALFSMPATVNTNTAVSFLNGPVDPCEPVGIVRNWDFGDGSTLANGGTSPSHTYTTAGNYTVKLTLTHSLYGTVTTTHTITVNTQLAFALHITGIVAYNLCTQQIIGYGDQGVGGNPLGTDTFTATPIGNYTNQFLWEQAYDTAPNTWVTLPGRSNTVTVSVPLNSDGSVSSDKTYTLRCTMLPQALQKVAITTAKIIFLAPNCNK
ncbi:YD repeat-containing protein [Mucilaginibacter sp. OK268]|uniref:PKD domain-containing protein n=1 Tax=Mucilaginibacter sp. OK268 TaxID=1881048 RepID=UPI0008816943|nr:PKD domain-containing protein [Mucilaginibacter sp. OK268]SDP86306.1 YD repeat-containing protein [Mucilaginibacter sp. OK268]